MWNILTKVSEVAAALERGDEVQSRQRNDEEWAPVRTDYVALYRDRAYRSRRRPSVLFGVEFYPVKVSPSFERTHVFATYYYPDFSRNDVSVFRLPRVKEGGDENNLDDLMFKSANGVDDFGSRRAYELGLVVDDISQAKRLLEGFSFVVLSSKEPHKTQAK